MTIHMGNTIPWAEPTLWGREEEYAVDALRSTWISGGAYVDRFETDFARRLVEAGGRIRYDPSASIRHLKVPAGGVRAWGDHRSSASPMHSVGDYYFARHHVRRFWPYVRQRLLRNVITRYHLAHPWAVVPKVIGELRGLALATKLAKKGRSLRE